MLEKTRGIVLHTIKYSDTGIVVQFYTRKFGRISALIRGIRKKKSGKHSIMFQPMFIIDMEMYHKPSRDVQLLKEFSLSGPFYDIQTNIRKSSVALFLGEVLSSVLREESPQEDLFDFIERSMIMFDAAKDNYANFHISFLTELSGWLGFEPAKPGNPDEVFFDMRNGRFTVTPPFNGEYAAEGVSKILARFIETPEEQAGTIVLTGKQRNEVLETILKYYSLHLPSLKKINSLDILKEVFS